LKHDMITGSPAKSLFFFALPMVLGNIFQQIYNITDSLIVGNFVGEKALAAVGASFSVTMLFVCVAIGAGIGSSVVISQLYGARRYKEMKTAVYTSLISISVIGILLTFAGVGLNKWILALMGTPDDIYKDAVDYLQIYFYGMLFVFIYNNVSSAFNALGDSRTPLYFLIFSSVLNIGLDILFITSFNMGVAGAAWATIISQAIAAVLALVFLLIKINGIEADGKAALFDMSILKKIFKIALPSIIQQSVVSVGMLFVQTVVNRFGSSVVAGYTAACKIDSIAIVPMLAVGNAMSTFTAQNIGAKQPERVKSGYKASLCMVGVMGAVIAFIMLFFGEACVGMFMDSENSKAAIAAGVDYINVTACFYFVFGFMNVTNGILRGAGAIVAFVLSSVGSLGVRVLIAFGLAATLNEYAVWIAAPIGWALSFIFAFSYYLTGKWKQKSLI